MQTITQFEAKYRKATTAPVQAGDTVRIHHLIKEGAKSRVQIFEGVVIRTRRAGSIQSDVTVRRIASGIGVEKTFLLHSPNVEKVDIVRRSKVRRNFLTYLRGRRGKSARLQEIAFDRIAANQVAMPVDDAVAEIAEIVAEDATIDNPTVAEVSTDEIIKEENAEVASEDDAVETASEDSADENELAAQETEAGIEKAEAAEDKESVKKPNSEV